MGLRNIPLLFLLISASLLSTSFADRKWRFMDKVAIEASATNQEISRKSLHHYEATDVHERLLRVNTKDYGKYDPAPALEKPPFKLIPN